MTNNFVSMKGGARDRWRHPRACCGTCAFPVLTSSTQPPSPPRACTQPGSGMAFDLAEKIRRQLRRAVRTRRDDFLFARGDLRDACSPDGCYQVIPHGQVAVNLSGCAGK